VLIAADVLIQMATAFIFQVLLMVVWHYHQHGRCMSFMVVLDVAAFCVVGVLKLPSCFQATARAVISYVTVLFHMATTVTQVGTNSAEEAGADAIEQVCYKG